MLCMNMCGVGACVYATSLIVYVVRVCVALFVDALARGQ